MSRLPLSLMIRFNKTKSAFFIFWVLDFQRISLSDNLEITLSVVIYCRGPKNIPVHRCSVVIFGPLGL